MGPYRRGDIAPTITIPSTDASAHHSPVGAFLYPAGMTDHTDQPRTWSRPTTDQPGRPHHRGCRVRAGDFGQCGQAANQAGHSRGHQDGDRLVGRFVAATDHRPTTPTTDIAPLVDHIATLEAKVERLTEASTMWQIRARQAEEQLKQLTTGEAQNEPAQGVPITQEREAAPIALESPESKETLETGIRAWWRRFWGI